MKDVEDEQINDGSTGVYQVESHESESDDGILYSL